ncbi:MAG: translation initiation factor IF-2 [Acidobacteriota bacterium]|nr:translation initiation factor IF-2 [Acidobacteriota bacterium]
MSKIRINELARQLEVKSREVIDKLHELGIAEKVTHSSSIDEDKADQLRRYYSGESHAPLPSAHRNGTAAPAREQSAPEHAAPETAETGTAAARKESPRPAERRSRLTQQPPSGAESEPQATEVHETQAQQAEPAKTVAAVPAPTPAPAVIKAEVPDPVVASPAPGSASAEAEKAEDDLKPRSLPLRPPVLGRGSPIHPPVGPRPDATPRVPLTPRPTSPGPGDSRPPLAANLAPGRPVPPVARPIPSGAPRLGQVLSGPRAPLPSNLAPRTAPQQAPPSASSAVPPSALTGGSSQNAMPGAPRPMPPQVRPGVPIGPPPRPAGVYQGGAPGQPRPAGPPPGQQGQRPLAGQPAVRPVVPPRPDLAARLGQQPPRSPMPGQAPPPRPGVPLRPQAPRPGQPLYQGPPRPGSGPMMGRSIGGRPPMPGQRPGGPRPMHPTSRTGGLIGPGAPPPPPDQAARRPQYNQQNRGRGGRDRQRDPEEKNIRPQTRREFAAPPPINRDITISEGITVKELSEKLDVKANFVIKKLVDRGIFATINQTLDAKLATDISREFGASTSTVTYEEEAMQDIETAEEATDLFRRPPVVTIMGHVDHGKTSLLDSIRLAHVADKEAGGITQHIGAYHVDHNGHKIVFIDTPGHEAFTRMRARGAKVTDIVILVVAADDGVMPQTIEAIDHARAARVPIIVAINKIDKAGAQVDRIKQQLSDRGLLAEDWGGDTVMVPVSARTKQNLDLLLEMILLVAELQDLKANPARPAMASVLEAKLDRGRGPVATVLVRNGTLRVGDYFICGTVFGRVRALLNDRGEPVKEVGPSMPVEVLGLEELPEAGDSFQTVTDNTKAKQIVLYRAEKERAAHLAKTGRITLEQFHKKMAAGEVQELPIILKADVSGSAEVLSDTLERLSTDKVTIRVIRSGVGAINESDVQLAAASNAIVIGFNVRPERNAAAAAEQEKVDIRLHTIIYEIVDEMKKAMAGMLAPVFKEVYRGKAEIREVFKVSRVGTVAGCLVMDGQITRDSQMRITRDNIVIHTGKVGSLRRFKDDVSDVRAGMECGITLENFGDVRQGDIIEAFVMQRVVTETA